MAQYDNELNRNAKQSHAQKDKDTSFLFVLNPIGIFIKKNISLIIIGKVVIIITIFVFYYTITHKK